MYPKVSVIIPVYNVERYIERCLDSLFAQTLKEIEYIFIDDGCTDNSIDKINLALKNYSHRINQVKILINPINKGLAYSRGQGLKNCSGEYIIYCDPDDYIELNMYELMYKKAISFNYDIVICNWFIHDKECQQIINARFKESSQEYLKNGMFNNFGYASMWNKLIRKEIINHNNIFPFEGCDYGEDLGCIMRILYYAKTISKVEYPLYHYCIRKNSITGGGKLISHELFKQKLRLVDNICLFFKGKGYDTMCNRLKFNTKLEGKQFYKTNIKEWIILYKECHKDIFKFKDNPIKIRILWYVALKHEYIYKILHFFKKEF